MPLHPLNPYNSFPSERKLHTSTYKLLTKTFFEEKKENDVSLFLSNLIINIKNNVNNETIVIKTKDDFEKAKNIVSDSYSFMLATNCRFENNKEINIDTVMYTIEQYLQHYDENYPNSKISLQDKKYNNKIKALKNIEIDVLPNAQDISNHIPLLNQCFEKINDKEFKIKYQSNQN